ncbi:ATP-binding cassette domain-containing protein [Streptomyces sp. NPDC048172]|uniref:ATP-binding cassette domain-containing protein n=1 Tax=Streptomyces sp. NPDC048172 TaxID=3365505 RepID=UPI00371B0C6C
MNAAIAQVVGLVQGYGREPVIEGLDLGVPSGVTGLLGPNGAGKTTLLRTLSTLLPPRDGRLVLFGQEIRTERDARRARRRIGALPQDFGYYPAFSVEDFVHYCAWLREVPKRARGDATRRALAAVGLEDRARERMKVLSGGMLRRAGIAAAIVGAPSLVLLDEPTVGLDPAQRLDFRRLIRSLAREGTAVVLSTHLVEDVQAVCDGVTVLSEGRVRYRGTPGRLAGEAVWGAAGDTPLERGYMSVLGEREGV